MARSCLDSGFQVSEGGVFTVAESTVGARVTGGGEVPADTTEDGF
jgi:hypothetical protein